jgi:hypothetical protein
VLPAHLGVDGAWWQQSGLMVTLDGLRDGSCAWLGIGKNMVWESPLTRRLSSAAPCDGTAEMRQRGAR